MHQVWYTWDRNPWKNYIYKLDLIKGSKLWKHIFYCIDGRLTYGESEIEDVLATEVPHLFERFDSGIRGDVRCNNILGLHASVSMGIVKITENSK